MSYGMFNCKFTFSRDMGKKGVFDGPSEWMG